MFVAWTQVNAKAGRSRFPAKKAHCPILPPAKVQMKSRFAYPPLASTGSKVLLYLGQRRVQGDFLA